MDTHQAGLLARIDLDELGSRIRAARLAAALTQGELAGADVSVGYISRIESGQRRPKALVLTVLAQRMGTSIEQLLTGVAPRELDQVRLTLDYAELSLESGEAVDAEAFSQEASQLAEAMGIADLSARAGYLHARAQEALGRLDAAIEELEPLLGRLEGTLRADAAIALCRCYRESGDLAKAVEAGERALEQLASLGLEDSDESVRTAVTLAAAHFERGDGGAAVRICSTAVARAERLRSPETRAAAYWNASILESERGSVQEAIRLAQRALGLLGEGRDARNLARLRTELGQMQLALDPPLIPEARANLEQAATDLAWCSASVVDKARNEIALAHSLFLDGEITKAMDLSVSVYDRVADQAPLLAAAAKVLEGQMCAAQGRLDQALEAYQRAALLLTGAGADRSVAQLWFSLGELLESADAFELARAAYRSAAAASGIGSGLGIGPARVNRGRAGQRSQIQRAGAEG